MKLVYNILLILLVTISATIAFDTNYCHGKDYESYGCDANYMYDDQGIFKCFCNTDIIVCNKGNICDNRQVDTYFLEKKDGMMFNLTCNSECDIYSRDYISGCHNDADCDGKDDSIDLCPNSTGIVDEHGCNCEQKEACNNQQYCCDNCDVQVVDIGIIQIAPVCIDDDLVEIGSNDEDCGFVIDNSLNIYKTVLKDGVCTKSRELNLAELIADPYNTSSDIGLYCFVSCQKGSLSCYSKICDQWREDNTPRDSVDCASCMDDGVCTETECMGIGLCYYSDSLIGNPDCKDLECKDCHGMFCSLSDCQEINDSLGGICEYDSFLAGGSCHSKGEEVIDPSQLECTDGESFDIEYELDGQSYFFPNEGIAILPVTANDISCNEICSNYNSDYSCVSTGIHSGVNDGHYWFGKLGGFTGPKCRTFGGCFDIDDQEWTCKSFIAESAISAGGPCNGKFYSYCKCVASALKDCITDLDFYYNESIPEKDRILIFNWNRVKNAEYKVYYKADGKNYSMMKHITDNKDTEFRMFMPQCQDKAEVAVAVIINGEETQRISRKVECISQPTIPEIQNLEIKWDSKNNYFHPEWTPTVNTDYAVWMKRNEVPNTMFWGFYTGGSIEVGLWQIQIPVTQRYYRPLCNRTDVVMLGVVKGAGDYDYWYKQNGCSIPMPTEPNSSNTVWSDPFPCKQKEDLVVKNLKYTVDGKEITLTWDLPVDMDYLYYKVQVYRPYQIRVNGKWVWVGWEDLSMHISNTKTTYTFDNEICDGKQKYRLVGAYPDIYPYGGNTKLNGDNNMYLAPSNEVKIDCNQATYIDNYATGKSCNQVCNEKGLVCDNIKNAFNGYEGWYVSDRDNVQDSSGFHRCIHSMGSCNTIMDPKESDDGHSMCYETWSVPMTGAVCICVQG